MAALALLLPDLRGTPSGRPEALLTELSVENYRSFQRPVSVPLGPLTVLFGPNGAGKTALLDALNQLATVLQGGSRTYVQVFHRYGPYSLREQRSDAAQPLRLSVTYQHETVQGPMTLLYELSLDENGNTVRGSEALQIDQRTVFTGAGNASGLRGLTLPDLDDQEALSGFLDSMRHLRRYRISPDRAREKADQAATFILPTGEGLAAALDSLFQSDANASQAYVDAVRTLYPSIADLSVRLIGEDTVLAFETPGGRQHSGAHLSDGQAVSLAILFLLQSSRAPHVLCFEELENGLSPAVLRAVLNLALDAVEEPGRPSQLLSTTHSPFVIAWAHEKALALQVSADGQVRTVDQVLQQRGLELDGPVTFAEACALLETFWYT